MRKSLWAYVLCFAFALTGCATNPSQPYHRCGAHLKPGETRVSYVTSRHTPKPATWVAFYPKSTNLKRPYRVIGKEVVSRYNFTGLERQSRTMDEIMKNLAASMGGDAVINVSADNQKVEGTVVSFEKVLL